MKGAQLTEPQRPAPPRVVEVRVTGIDLPFADLLLLAIKLIGIQVVIAAFAGLVWLALRGY